MRAILFSISIALLALPVNRIRADDPKAIVEKAVAAIGGEEKAARLGMRHLKAKGTVFVGPGLPFTMETFVRLPDQFKNVIDIELPNQRVVVTEVLSGGRAWVANAEAVGPADAPKAATLKANVFLFRVLSLTPLLKDKSIQLSALDDADVDGKPASGVKVAAEGQHEIFLWFAKDTGLLAKLERTVRDDGRKIDVRQEEILTDYRTMDGIPTAMKQVWRRGGNKVAELEFTEVHYPTRIEDREFDEPKVERNFRLTPEVIYGRKMGLALTFDVYTPKANANGAGVIAVMSGGWYSDRTTLGPFLKPFIQVLVDRGYTVFAVVHGSQPIFTIPDAVADINRSVRFIRLHAKEYHIDPNRIGITGGSAGGHLSLMQGVAGDTGKKDSKDPVEHVSSRVQAVACFYPPTDFLNYGGQGKYGFALDGLLVNFRTAIDYRELDPKTHQLEHLSDEKQRELARLMSPITHVTADDPPTLIVHGDEDPLVPISQAQAMIDKLRSVGVPAELAVKKGAKHGWPNPEKEVALLANWFDKYLAKK
jgi:acetyl esterase/lipase